MMLKGTLMVFLGISILLEPIEKIARGFNANKEESGA